MASTSANVTSTCPYTSVNDVLVKADAGALNITLLV